MNKKSQTVIGACIALATAYFLIPSVANSSWRDIFNSPSREDILISLVTYSDECPEWLPLQVMLTNNSKSDITNYSYSLTVWDEGHSTKFHSRSTGALSSDAIVEPGKSQKECFPMPSFEADNGIPAFDVPQSLLSPKFEIDVAGVTFS